MYQPVGQVFLVCYFDFHIDKDLNMKNSLLVAALFAIALTACGKKEAAPAPIPAPAPAAEAPAAAPAPVAAPAEAAKPAEAAPAAAAPAAEVKK